MKTRYQINFQFFEEPPQFGDIVLYQLGKNYCEKSMIVAPHLHKNWFELTMIASGNGTILTNDVPTPVKQGNCYLSFPCETHSIVSDDDNPLEYLFFAFYPTSARYQTAFDKIIQDFYPSAQRILNNESLINLTQDAIYEYASEPNEYTKDLLQTIFNQIVLLVLKGFLTIQKGGPQKNITQADALCYQLMNYINTHIYTLTNLKEVAGITNYSYSYLSMLFKRTTGQTLLSYYQDCKLKIARYLLLENKLKIGEIAERLNYASIYAFSRAFKNKYHLSPMQVKKSAKGALAE